MVFPNTWLQMHMPQPGSQVEPPGNGQPLQPQFNTPQKPPQQQGPDSKPGQGMPPKDNFPQHRPSVLPFLFWGGGAILQFLLIFIISFLLRISQRLNDIGSQKLKAEVQYLKAQINPHFLFNTLNSLYALALEKSDAAPEAILKLSAMMRYIVTESDRDAVPLEEELGYIKNYISLQRLRMDDAVSLTFIISGKPAGKSISPMLLIPFIDNAFKYGVNPERESEISISVNIGDADLVLNVKNNKVYACLPDEEKSETGMENTRKRLEYLYPNKYRLHIVDTDTDYEVQLTLSVI